MAQAGAHCHATPPSTSSWRFNTPRCRMWGSRTHPACRPQLDLLSSWRSRRASLAPGRRPCRNPASACGRGPGVRALARPQAKPRPKGLSALLPAALRGVAAGSRIACREPKGPRAGRWTRATGPGCALNCRAPSANVRRKRPTGKGRTTGSWFVTTTAHIPQRIHQAPSHPSAFIRATADAPSDKVADGPICNRAP